MSNFKLLFAQIPFFDGISAQAPTTPVASGLFGGSFRNYWRGTETETLTLTFPIAQTPLLLTNNVASYLALKGVKGLFNQVVDVSFEVVALASSTPLGSFNVTKDADDLVDDTLYLPLTFTPAITNPVDEYTVEIDWGDDEILPAISKVFFGTPFDFGANPVYNQSQSVLQQFFVSITYAGELVFERINVNVAADFMRYIVPFLPRMSFILYDDCGRILPKSFIYCRLSEPEVEYINNRVANLSFNFIELT